MAVLNLLYEVWKRDPDGDRYVDWRRLAEEVGYCAGRADKQHMDVAYSFA
jgi:uncharacterized protein YihD (DUF1040 family)